VATKAACSSQTSFFNSQSFKMKNILFLALAAGICITAAPTTEVQAQPKVERVAKLSTDTLTNADTVIIASNVMPKGLKSLQITVRKLTGTPLGQMIIQGSDDGNAWVNVASDTMLNLSYTTTSYATTTGTGYNYYRAWVRSYGTVTATVTFAWRREDD